MRGEIASSRPCRPGTRRAPGVAACARLSLLLALLAAPAVSTAGEEAPPTVVLLHGEDTAHAVAWEDLRQAVEAHLSPYTVRVLTRSVPDVPADTPEIRRLGGTDVAALIWLDAPGAILHLWIPSLGEQLRVRSVPDAPDGWLARCEMLASIVLSELEPALSDPPPTPTPASDPGAASSTTTHAENDPVPPSVVDTGSSPTATFFLGLGVAYLPVLLSADAPYLHGLGLAVVAGIGPRFEMGLGFDFVQPLGLGPDYGDGRLVRRVLRAGLSANLGRGDVDLCLGGGAVIEFARVGGLDYLPLDGSAVEMHERGGIRGFARFRYRPLAWLSLVMEGGADVYLTPLYLMDGDVELARRTPVQPRIAVGVMGWFGRP